MSAPSIPDHTLLKPIGRGAYGEVWLARNIMGTPRAVKIIWRRQFESDRPYDREFAGIQGYEPVSRSSDGLMQVLHVGRNDSEGYFYYVMELADSVSSFEFRVSGSEVSVPLETQNSKLETYSPRTLRSDMKRLGRLPIADCLRVALDVVGGLARLHDRGLVHRDVKPGNIIFVNGRAKLADIGLVSTRNEGRTFVGTEGYIPPEGPGSPTADLFALGMVLYEAATGQPPEKFPQTPIEWFAERAGGERIEFHEIVLKAGEGARERRYQTAGALQGDLALLQSGQSLRRVRALQRRANFSRRLALAAGVAVAAAVASVLLGNYRVRVETEQRAREQAWRHEAEHARAKAEHAERQAREQLLAALTEQARADVRSGELGQRMHTLDAVRRAAAITNSPELRHSAVAALVLPDLRFDREIPLPPDITLAGLDPAFERLALGSGTNAVEIRSAADNSILAILPASVRQSAHLANWSSDGRYVAITRAGAPLRWEANVEIWELPAARRVLTLPNTRYGACSFHPRLPQLLAAHLEDTVGIWDLTDGRAVARHAVTGQVHHLKFSPDGESFVVQHRVGKAWFTSLLQTSNGKVRSSTPSGWVDALAWHPQDKYVALASRQGEVYLHNRQSGETSVLGRHKNEARTAAFSPDGGFLFTGGEEQEIICWNLAMRQRAFSFAARGAQIQFAGTSVYGFAGVRPSPGAETHESTITSGSSAARRHPELAAAGDGRTPLKAHLGMRCAILTRSGLRLHEFVRPAACRDLPVDLGPTVRRAAFSPDGRWLAAGGLTGLGVWDLSGDGSPTIIAQAEHPTPFFSPDSSELLAFSIEGLKRWRLEANGESSRQLHPLPVPTTDRVYSGQFAAGSLFLGTEFGVLMAPETNPAGPAEYFKLAITTAAVSLGKEWVAVEKKEGLEVFRLKPWTSVFWLNTSSAILTHAFVPVGEELTVATPSGLTFLRTNDWQAHRQLPVALDRHARILFAPDGRSFWLAHDARTAALYDTRSLALLLSLAPGVLPLAISPDGGQLLVTIDSGRLQLWNWTMLRRELEELGLGWTE
jgi:WD40 repeat protein